MNFIKKIPDVAQIRSADSYTMDNEPISSIDLMERASNAFVNAIFKEEILDKKVIVVCGVGNNGGDGLAVARLLSAKGVNVHCILLKYRDLLSKDCQTNFDRIDNVEIWKPNSPLPDFSKYDIIIDAILGSGITKPIKGDLSKIVSVINKFQKTVYSIDIPSGLYSDEITPSKNIICSDLAISFQRPKMAFFFPENNVYIKDWKTVDIGLDEGYIQSLNTKKFVIDQSISTLLRKRPRYSHKGTYGHALIIAGSYGKIGAAILATRASLRSGAGLVTSYLPKCGYQIIQSSVPEAMCLIDPFEKNVSQIPDVSQFSSICIGPGLGKSRETAAALQNLLEIVDLPIVIDADGLNIISENKKLLNLVPKNSILTPHIKEFEQLFGISQDSYSRFEKQRELSVKHQCIIVLKDAHTCISSPNGNLYFNTSGNPGMATGGSGDVLTGIITGLLAQGYQPINAALLAVYFHGLAGDKASKTKGQNAIMASDIVDNLRIEAQLLSIHHFLYRSNHLSGIR